MPMTIEEYKEAQAQSWWNEGRRPSFSTNIAEMLTCGYGKLDFMGEFEYPLAPGEEYFARHKAMVKAGLGYID